MSPLMTSKLQRLAGELGVRCEIRGRDVHLDSGIFNRAEALTVLQGVKADRWRKTGQYKRMVRTTGNGYQPDDGLRA